jgi:hypothetical protein
MMCLFVCMCNLMSVCFRYKEASTVHSRNAGHAYQDQAAARRSIGCGYSASQCDLEFFPENASRWLPGNTCVNVHLHRLGC